MNQIELSFRNQKIFMLKEYIVGLTNKYWFLKKCPRKLIILMKIIK